MTIMKQLGKSMMMALLCMYASFESYAQEVAPMVSAKYSQSAPYNNSCPDNSAAGCGPVAVAQILSKYKQPAHGYGKVTYTSGTNKYAIDANLEDMAFDWNHIRDEYKSSYTSTEAKAVADLIFACGAAMYVQYGTSTAVSNYAMMLYGMQHNLHISADARYLKRQYYSTAEWIELLNAQLRAGHPVFYRGSWLFNGGEAGHMFVIDGLDADGKYHVNFGHLGSGDKYADINILNQSGTYPGGRGVCYNASQAMVINCYPTPDATEYPIQRCISEGTIVLNEDATLKQVTVNLGEKISLSCCLRNYSLEKATVNYGWGLVKDGRLVSILRQRTYGLSAGYIFVEERHLDFALPTDLEDGNYQLSMYSKSDVDPTWNKVWTCAPTDVDLVVSNGKATVTVPDCHVGDAQLYIEDEIGEVTNSFESYVSGRAFELKIANPSTNNFQDRLKLEIVADGVEYSYETTQPVYSQTQVTYQVLVPQTAVDLKGKSISSVKAYYYDSTSETYKPLLAKGVSGVNAVEASKQSGDIYVYTTNGMLVKHIAAKNVAEQYGDVLNSLSHGIYVVKEGGKTRKIIF